MRTPLVALALLLAVLAAPADSQIISGTVHDSSGLPLEAVNIDAFDAGSGDKVVVLNGGTNGDGQFSTTLPAPGIYDIVFTPPAPPDNSDLKLTVESVVVVTTTNMGIVGLPAGVALFGTVQDSFAFAVDGVDLDFEDASGDKLDIAHDSTDSSGDFAVAVPAGFIEFQIDTNGFGPPTLVAQSFDLDIVTTTNIGVITLQPGFVVTLTVEDNQGQGVQGADVDATDSVTNVKVFTPGDNTDQDGQADVIVPAGTFDFDACPPFDDQLVGVALLNQTIAGNVDLGTLVSQPGHVLSGTVTDLSLNPIAGVDLDVNIAGGGVEIVTCADNTDANGDYQIVVPTGTFDVEFEPSYALPFASKTILNVAVAGATSLDTVLPDCPGGSLYGAGLAGTGGIVPSIATSGGSPRLGNPDFQIDVTDAVGGGTLFMLLGFAPSAIPFKGGTLNVDITGTHFVLTLPLFGTPGVGGTGFFSLPLPVPTDPIATGLTFYAQGVISDPGAIVGFALTPGMDVTFCP